MTDPPTKARPVRLRREQQPQPDGRGVRPHARRRPGRGVQRRLAAVGPGQPRAVEFMQEVGYDLTAHHSKALADLPAGEFDAVVGMGCGDEGCPLVPARRHEEWGIPDPKEMPAERVPPGPRPDRAEGQGPAWKDVTTAEGNGLSLEPLTPDRTLCPPPPASASAPSAGTRSPSALVLLQLLQHRRHAQRVGPAEDAAAERREADAQDQAHVHVARLADDPLRPAPGVASVSIGRNSRSVISSGVDRRASPGRALRQDRRQRRVVRRPCGPWRSCRSPRRVFCPSRPALTSSSEDARRHGPVGEGRR